MADRPGNDKRPPRARSGIGAIKVNYAIYQAEAKKKMKIVLRGTSESQVHNEYLQVWAETGTAGLAAFVFILVTFFMNAFRSLRERGHSMPWLTIGIISAVSGLLVDSLSNFPLHIVPTSFLFWSYTGMSFRTGAKEHKSFALKQPLLRTVLVFFIAVIFIKAVFNEFAADLHRRSADLAFEAGDWKGAIAGYRKAHGYSPVNGRICYDLGMAYVNKKDYPSAVKAFRESIRIRNYGEVYNDLANCNYLLGDIPEAIKNWEIAVQLELPDSDAQEKVRHNLRLLKKEPQ